MSYHSVCWVDRMLYPSVCWVDCMLYPSVCCDDRMLYRSVCCTQIVCCTVYPSVCYADCMLYAACVVGAEFPVALLAGHARPHRADPRYTAHHQFGRRL